MVNTDKRLQLVKNEGHVLCHTKVAPGETGVVIPTLHTLIHIEGKQNDYTNLRGR